MKFFVKYVATVQVFLTGFFINSLYVLAQSSSGGNDPYSTSGTGGSVSLLNPINFPSLCQLLQEILRILLAFGVPIAVLFLVYAGFLFVKARGNPKELIHARANFKYVILGILLFLGAWMLGQIIASTVNALGAGTGAPGIGSCR